MNTFSNQINDANLNDSKENLKDSLHKVEDSVKETSTNLRAVANDAGTKLRQFITEQSDKASTACQEAEKKIHQNPLKSTLIAAVIGMLFGALLRR